MDFAPVVAAMLVSLILGYRSRCRIYLGPLDPLKLLAIQEAAWSATVAQLHLLGLIEGRAVVVFTLTLVLWWTAWRTAPSSWCRRYRESVRTIWLRVALLDHGRLFALTCLYVIPAAIFVAAAATLGGGDNRLAVVKILRPLEAFTSLLAPVILFRALVSRSRWRWPAVAFVLSLIVLAGGKGAILVVLVPITGAQLIGRMNSDTATIRRAVLVLVVGLFASVTINYDVASPLAVLEVIGTRVLLEGDVYLISLGADWLGSVSLNSIWTYVFGPLIKATLLPIEVDQHLGSQMASAALGEDTPTGPNAHWPVVLMALGIYDAATVALLSIALFGSVMLIKLRILSPRRTRRYPMAVVIPAAMFVLQFPQTFFMDPPFQFVFMVHAIFLSIVLCIVLVPFDLLRHDRPVGAHRLS